MIVAIPIATGQYCYGSVIESINRQTVKTKIIICDSPGEIRSQGNFTLLRRKGEAESRNKCIDAMLDDGDKYAVMQDRDGEHIYDTNLIEMIKLLDNNDKIGVLSIAYPNTINHHVDIRCAMYRKEILEKLYFDGNQKTCCCNTVRECCEKMKYECKYFDDKNRLLHIHN